MADIQVPGNQWVNAATLAGLSAGAALMLQNKNTLPVIVQESATQPASSNHDGYLLGYGKVVEIDAGSTGVWLFSHTAPARVFVQET